MAPEITTMILPVRIATPSDVGRLLREFNELNNAMLQAGIRSGDHVAIPKLSHLMEQVVQDNKLDLTQAADRQRLSEFLTYARNKAPVLHMSFSVDPAPLFIEKLMTWIRKEIHPQALLTVGLQPTIGAGCIVRSTNKQFDFSLRNAFHEKRELLQKALAAAPAPVAAVATVPADVPAPAAAHVAPAAVPVSAEVPA